MNSPPLSVRAQSDRPMALMSARNLCTYGVICDLLLLPYGRIYREALSMHMIR